MKRATIIDSAKLAPRKAKVGRRPAIAKLSPDQIQDACDALELGFPLARVANLIGVPESTFSKMLKRDEDVGAVFRAAKENGVKKNLAIIQAAANRSWQAAAWLLERCNGQEFAQPKAGTVNNVQINLQNLLSAQAKRPKETEKPV